MTLKDARKLRDIIRKHGLHCVTPMAGSDPNRFFARIWGIKGQRDFYSLKEWKKYERPMLKRKAESINAAEELAARGGWEGFLARRADRRTPLERMIDQASDRLFASVIRIGATEKKG